MAPVRVGHPDASPGTYASLRCASTGLAWPSIPKISARPATARINPSSNRIVMVLPAPLAYSFSSRIGYSEYLQNFIKVRNVPADPGTHR